MPRAPTIPPAAIRWAAGCFLSSVLAASAAIHEVAFSCLLPEADRVYLLGSFNEWKTSDDALMANDGGVWRKSLSLAEGEYAYKFKAEGPRIDGDGWRRDWKAPRETRNDRGPGNSLLAVPGDLDVFRARQRPAERTERGIEIPLSYDRHPDEPSSFRPSGYSFGAPVPKRPEGKWKLPAFADATPLYVQLPLGEAKALAVLDRSSPEAPFYDRLHFDRNVNRDLTDDPPIIVEPESNGHGYFHAMTPPIDLEVQTGGNRFPYSMTIRFAGSLPAAGPGENGIVDAGGVHYIVFSHCSYLGEFALDGAGYRLALGDGIPNGRFGDPIRPYADLPAAEERLYSEGDTLYLCAADRVDVWDGQFLGKYLALGSRLFEVHLDVAGGKLVLEERPDRLGTLEFPAPVERMTLQATSGKRDGLMLHRVGRQAQVPAGTWRMLDCQIHKLDEWGAPWTIRATGSRKAPAVEVAENGTASLAVGEPLRTVVDVPERQLRTAAGGGSVRLDLAILGNAGEFIDDVFRSSDVPTKHPTSKRRPDRPAEATYRIVKPDGERVASGSFEYG